MAIFENSQRVSVKTQPYLKGTITFVHPFSRGKQFYEVMLDDGSSVGYAENELINEIIIKDPWKLFALNQFKSYKDFSIETTIFKVENTANNTISTLKASRTLFKAYQFKPLIKFLNSDTRRILVADEVGLGKTIEAGHILLELAGRKLLRNALVICPKSLQLKWKTELSEKFHFEFKIYENTNDLASDIERDINLGQQTLMGIINYEKMRPRKDKAGNEANSIAKLLNERSYSIDLLICDEAHKVRNHTTAQHKGIKMLLDKNAVSAVFLTATPIMTSIENLYNLISLLDNRRYFNFELFNNAIKLNRPFIKALNSLHRQIPLLEIAEELEGTMVYEQYSIGENSHNYHASIGEKFADDELYQKSIDLMKNGDGSYATKAKIQEYLTDLNSLNHIYTRTRKKQVLTEDEVIFRDAKHFEIDMTEAEKDLYDQINEQYDEGNLGLVQKKRQLASSIIAQTTSDSDLNGGYYNKNITDSKFELFFERIVRGVVIQNNNKLIVFAFFKKTLKYLKIRLEQLGIGCQIIHGDIIDRNERIHDFKDNATIKVLLSSEVGSEGLDLQFCNAVVNYDLPWNPMVVEQRIGRIDRVGQQSRIINIYSFALKNTIEQKIYHRLLERIRVFKESLGDLEEILGEDENLFKDIQKLENELYSTKLTEKQQIQKIDIVAMAVEKQKLDLQKLETDLTDAIVNDFYFKDEINSIESNNRYITHAELESYTESIFAKHLKTCLFKKKDEVEYVIEVPNSNKNVLLDFISEYMDMSNTEIEKLYGKFRMKHRDELQIKVTYDQEYSFRNPNVEFINVYHPLINAITNYYKKAALHINQAHVMGLSRKHISDEYKIHNGHYILVIYNINIDRKEYNKDYKYQYIHSCLVDINGDQASLVSREVSDYILGLAPLYCREAREIFDFNEEFVALTRTPVVYRIREHQEEVEQNERIKVNSIKHRRIELERKYYDNKINHYNSLLSNLDYEAKIRRVWEAELVKTLEEKNSKIESIMETEVKVTHSYISVNHLEIFD